MSDLPYHLVVGMPALSPTMEAGTISAWRVSEGDSFAAGDSLAEIETDKATIDFEAQDDGVVAKILVEAGSNEIKVGVPVLVTVEEEDDVKAFKDFVVEAPAESEAPPTIDLVIEEKPAAAIVEETSGPPLSVQELAPPTQVPVVEAVAPVEAEIPLLTESSLAIGPKWGNLASVKSPLAKTLTADQKKYVEMYGSTGQIPL